MSRAHDHFVPALGVHWLTPFYDIACRLAGDRRFKRRLLEKARILPGHDVLDIGCGTGTLVLMAHGICPEARIVGLDIDPRILAIAARKIARTGAPIEVKQASATDLPFPSASFDRILSTVMLHHLTTAEKRETLSGARRLLRPGGEIHIADFGKPHNALMRVASLAFRHFEEGETMAGNLGGELPAMMRDTGFEDVAETEHRMTLFGTLTFLSGRVPA